MADVVLTVSQPSYASGASTMPLLGDTIGENLARMVADHPSQEALVDVPTGRRWTYQEFQVDVRKVARALLATGAASGDRVGIWAPNCPEWVLVQYATAVVGIVLVNINPAYRRDELDYALNQSGVTLLVTHPPYKNSDYPAMAASVVQSCPTLRQVVTIGTPEWDEFIAAGNGVSDDRLDERAAMVDFDDPVNVQYTSGTTGSPKGATLSHHNILNNGFFVAELLGYTAADRVCLPVPFYHCFGMVMGNLGATSHGACIVIPERTFDPEATLRAVAQERCTSLFGVPTMFIAELETQERLHLDLSSLRTGIMAGSPCPVEVMKRVISELHMPEVTICYGMTETAPVSTQTRREDGVEDRTTTVGRAVPHVEVKIVDPATGRLLPRGQAGELCTRGYSVMIGYWNAPEQTSDAIDDTGWMHTGDLAVMRADGYVNVVGRIKDMIIRGGENVYPRELEEMLHSHPDIADVQVVGVPDQRYGEEIAACIKLRENATPVTPEGLRSYFQDRMAHHKLPRHVVVVDEYPLTVTGKVRKNELRDRAISLLGLAAPASVQ